MKELFEKYINNQATPEEERRLSQAIAENPALHQWFMEQIASCKGEIPNKQHILDSIHQLMKKPKAPLRTKIYKKKLQYAAVALLLIFMGISHWFFIDNQRFIPAKAVTVTAERGQKAEITLPDGSHVKLNADTKITYSSDYDIRNRDIHLSGEAYFSVASNRTKPFIVHTESMIVEAVGTQFNVKAYANEDFATTTLFEGKVCVDAANESITLLPNEQLELNKKAHRLTKRSYPEYNIETDWLNDKIEFRQNSFSEVAATLSRIYNVEIVIRDNSLKTERFSGTINNNSLESTLKILTLTAPFDYTYRNDTITIFRKEN